MLAHEREDVRVVANKPEPFRNNYVLFFLHNIADDNTCSLFAWVKLSEVQAIVIVSVVVMETLWAL